MKSKNQVRLDDTFCAQCLVLMSRNPESKPSMQCDSSSNRRAKDKKYCWFFTPPVTICKVPSWRPKFQTFVRFSIGLISLNSSLVPTLSESLLLLRKAGFQDRPSNDDSPQARVQASPIPVLLFSPPMPLCFIL